MYEVKDTVVLITGAAKGIGAAFVKILVEKGAKHVRILDIDEAAGEVLQNELNEKHGADRVIFTKCDITNDKEFFRAFKSTTEQYGYIMVLSKTALINGTVKAIDLMRKDKGGRGGTVLNVSSIAALIQSSPSLFVYAASKSAVLQFSNCIGKEPYHSTTGVRVITICYDATTTGIIEQMASFDEDIPMYKIAASFSKQSTEVAAQGTLEAYRRGESGKTWLINNGKPAVDITSTINKAYAEFAHSIELTLRDD